MLTSGTGGQNASVNQTSLKIIPLNLKKSQSDTALPVPPPGSGKGLWKKRWGKAGNDNNNNDPILNLNLKSSFLRQLGAHPLQENDED